MTIEIWNPRWHDRIALIAPFRVKNGMNKITFTKAKSLKDKIYTMTGEDIRKYPLQWNGKIMCHAVPLDKLTEIE